MLNNGQIVKLDKKKKAKEKDYRSVELDSLSVVNTSEWSLVNFVLFIVYWKMRCYVKY